MSKPKAPRQNPVKVLPYRGKTQRGYHRYDLSAPAPKPWFYKDGKPLVPTPKLKAAPEGSTPRDPKEESRVRQMIRAKYER